MFKKIYEHIILKTNPYFFTRYISLPVLLLMVGGMQGCTVESLHYVVEASTGKDLSLSHAKMFVAIEQVLIGILIFFNLFIDILVMKRQGALRQELEKIRVQNHDVQCVILMNTENINKAYTNNYDSTKYKLTTLDEARAKIGPYKKEVLKVGFVKRFYKKIYKKIYDNK